jgi:outer membrane protein OmpA-like peptidoglycan-associated protein
MEASMAVSIEQLRRILNADEPDYDGLARQGAALLPQLAQLVNDRNEYVAANAASLAGMIGDNQAVAVLQRAARSASGAVRSATAGALRSVRGPQVAALVATLQRDRDPDVRKFAAKAAAMQQPGSAAAEIGETFEFEEEGFGETEWGEAEWGEQESEWGEGPFGETFEFGQGTFEREEESRDTPARGAPCPPQPVNVDCPPPGTPTETLDRFAFDNGGVNPTLHGPRIAALARRIIAGGIRSALIAGHTDVVGDDNYNFQLGWRRARAVMDALCRELESQRPGFSRTFRFQLTSCGERQPKSTAEQSRRVEIFLPTGPTPGGQQPDPNGCGVPVRALRGEISLEEETQQRGRVGAAPAVRAEARLSLFQNAKETSHRNHFQVQARRWARRIAAVRNPTATNCPRRVGETRYDSGANIIQAIVDARACTGTRVTAVHIFSHSNPRAVAGSLDPGSIGLYRDSVDAASRRGGARTIAEIPTAPLSDNVVFVLHGCRLGLGPNSFAEGLFKHLAKKLKNPIVFAHPNRGCAGRDNSWREFSKRAPTGARRSSIAPHYSGNGCCDDPCSP